MIAIVLVATGREEFIQFVEPLIASLKKFFPPHHTILFTDSEKSFDAMKIYQRAEPWPWPSLMRYHMMHSQHDLLSRYSHIFFMDADMLVMQEVFIDDICSDGLTAVLQPGFPDGRNGRYDAFERRRESTAYVEGNPPYYQGCFQGGRTAEYLHACKVLSYGIDLDNLNKIISSAHDESHWNHYLAAHPPTTVLTPAWCWPSDSYWIHSKLWTDIEFKDFSPIIRHLEKQKQSWKGKEEGAAYSMFDKMLGKKI